MPNKFVHSMFEEMKVDQALKYKVVRDEFKSYIDRLESFAHIADEAFPRVEKDSNYACRKALKAKRYLEITAS